MTTERNNKLAGYAGVKDAEVNKSLPTQGGGAGNRETVAQWLHDEVGGEWPNQLVGAVWPLHDNDDGYRGDGAYARLQPKDVVEHFRDIAERLLSRFPLQVAPSEGGEPVGWGLLHPQNGLMPLTYGTRDKAVRQAERVTSMQLEPVALYAARPPAPSEEPLVGCVVVPREPTTEMVEAAIQAASFYVHTYEDGQTPVEPVSAIIYRAMIAAAPAPDAIRGGEGALQAASRPSVPSSGKSDTEAKHGAAK